MAEISFGPYQPDVATIGTSQTSYVKNVFPSINGYSPMRGISSFTSALTGNCRGLVGTVQLDGSSVIFAGSDTKLYKLDGTTRTWGDVTRASGGDYSVGARELWDFCQFGNTVIATTDSNAVQSFTLGSSTKFAALSGSPPQARRCSVVGDFVVLSSLSASGEANRIQWSAINDATGWTVGTNQCDYQDFPDGGFVQGVSGGEIGLVFQDRAIRRMIYVGPPNIFEFQRVSESKGVLLRYSICKSAGVTYFLSNDGFYKVDLSGALSPIGATRVNNTILADLDTTDHRHMIGVADPVSPRVMWFYKSNSSSSGNYHDKVVIYDWNLDRWSYGELTTAFAAPALQLSATLEGLDAVSSSLDALPYSLDVYNYDYTQQILVMGGDNKAGFLNGDTLEATIDTPEGAIGNGVRTFVRDLAPVGDASNAYISVRYRDRLIDSLTTSTESQIGVRGYAPQRVNARFNTARVRVAAGQEWTYLRGVDVNGRSGGLR